MKKRTKVILKFWAIFSIVLFLLIPLLSSPVAATVKFENIGARSNNSAGAGPIVSVLGPPGYSYDLPGNYNRADDGTGSIKFSCDCYQIDNNPGGQGSVHYMELNVQKIAPRPYGSLLSVGMYRQLNPGQTASPYPTVLSITTNYTVGQSNWETFDVYVYAEVTDNATQASAWNTWHWYVTIV